MRAEQNPYAPGSGLRPPELAGRADEIAAFDLVVARTRERMHSRPILLHGLRGVGKTVLLRRFQDRAQQAEWLIVSIEAGSTDSSAISARQRLARSMASAVYTFNARARIVDALRGALPTVTSFTLGLGGSGISFGVDPNPVRATSGVLEVDLGELIEDLAPALKANGTALAVFIDELQDLDGELLAALITAQHRAGQEGTPFYVFGAGLPSLPAIVSEARSYAERLFDYRGLGALPADQARDAVVLPAGRLGAEFDDDAVAAIVDAAEGYPYFLQTYAMKTWDAARDRRIRVADAELGIQLGRDDLDMGFYPARWGRTTGAERRYLLALAELGQAAATSEVAARLGTSLQSLSTARQNLIDKGLVFAPERGRVAFTVPGMAGYIARNVRTSAGDD